MNDEQIKNLVKVIEESGEWERIPTTITGVNIVKPPENNNQQNVLVEVFPVHQGQIIKRKGVYIKNLEELEAFKEILLNPKVKELTEVISTYYNKKKITKIEI